MAHLLDGRKVASEIFWKFTLQEARKSHSQERVSQQVPWCRTSRQMLEEVVKTAHWRISEHVSGLPLESQHCCRGCPLREQGTAGAGLEAPPALQLPDAENISGENVCAQECEEQKQLNKEANLSLPAVFLQCSLLTKFNITHVTRENIKGPDPFSKSGQKG